MRCFIFNGPVKASNDSSTLGSKVTHPLSKPLPLRPLPLSYLLQVQSKRDAGRGAHCARSSAECECLVIKLEGKVNRSWNTAYNGSHCGASKYSRICSTNNFEIYIIVKLFHIVYLIFLQ